MTERSPSDREHAATLVSHLAGRSLMLTLLTSLAVRQPVTV